MSKNKVTKGFPLPERDRVRVPSREFARQLRRQQTDAENLLWKSLRSRQLQGAKFRRQHPIGIYIVDFCCPEHHLIIEVDGGKHNSELSGDRQRDSVLMENGYRVLRFWNHEVLKHLDLVLERIVEAIGWAEREAQHPPASGFKG